MKQKRWWVLLSVVSVLLMFCAVRAVKRTVASGGAHSIEVCEGRAQSDQNDIDAQLEKAIETMAVNSFKATRESQLKQQEATKEAQLRQQEAEQLRTLDDQLRSLDKDITQKRQKVETWYAQNLAHLRRWAEQRKRELDNAERVAYAQCMQQMKNTSSVTQRDLSANGYTYSSGYVSPYGQLYGRSSTTVQGRSFETTDTYIVGNPAAQYQATVIQIRQARQAVEREFVRLEQRKKEELAMLDAEQERKTTTIHWYKGRAQRETARQLSENPDLLVEVIGVGKDDKFYAQICGKDVREGSVVNGYKVRKICADRVEFEKDGQVFIQKID